MAKYEVVIEMPEQQYTVEAENSYEAILEALERYREKLYISVIEEE